VHTLFSYIASREPEMLGVCQQVAAIPMKRAAPAETHYLEREEVEALFRDLPRTGRLALRDRALLLFLYNTGARVQEVADLRIGDLDLGGAPLVRLHGKGDKWRTCPLWRQTAALLEELLDSSNTQPAPDTPVFRSTTGEQPRIIDRGLDVGPDFGGSIAKAQVDGGVRTKCFHYA
jgi:integrase